MPRKRRTAVDDLRALAGGGLEALRVADQLAENERSAGITRALLVLRELHRAPQTMPSLARALGVHPRTVARIVQAIERAGIEVTRTRERDTRGRMGEVVYRVEGLGTWLSARKEDG